MAASRRTWALSPASFLLAGLLAGGSAARAAELDTANLRLAQGDAQLDRKLALILISERGQGGIDLNGDGDGDDNVVHVFDAASRQLRNLGLATADGLSVVLRDQVVVIGVDEASQGRDLNGDGDRLDSVLHAVEGARGEPINFRVALGAPVFQLERDGRRFIAMVSEAAQGGTDLNGDGDAEDLVLHIGDVQRGEARSFRLAGQQFDGQIQAGSAAFVVPEAAQGHRDLNGDGDAEDVVLHVIDLERGRARNTRLDAALSFQLDGRFVALAVSELAQGRDLNGDGDLFDASLHVVNVADGGARNLRLDASSGFRIRDGRLTFSVLEAEVGVDLNGDGDVEDPVVHAAEAPRFDPVNLQRAGFAFPIRSGVVMLVPEFFQEADLNGDGDGLDVVLQLFTRLRPRDVVNTRVAIDSTSISEPGSDGEAILAFLVNEREQGGRDLNGDGDTDDAVLHVADPRRGSVVNSGLAAVVPFVRPFPVRGSHVVVPVSEAAQGARDLDGDGLVADLVLHVFDASARRAQNARVAIDASFGFVTSLFPVDGFVAFQTPERTRDLNGDGDLQDAVLSIVELATATPTRVPLAVTSVGENGGSRTSGLTGPGLGDAFSFGVLESAQGNTDLNGDGDTDDVVAHAVRLEDRNRDRILDFVQR